MKKNLTLILGAAAAVTVFIGCDKLKPIGSRSSGITPAKDAVKVQMFIMSKCPYGVQAVQGIKPALDEFGNMVDFQIDFIGDERGGQLTSMHGEPEVKGDILQLCAVKHYPDPKKWMSFIDCQNKNWTAIPDGWEACADKNGMDKGKIKTCFEGNEGKDLLKESFKRAKAANAQGSPTIKVAGAPYEGGRSKTDFMRAICEKYSATKPGICSKIPEDVVVNAVILSDKRCKTCQTAGLEANLKGRFFPKLQTKNLDWGTDEGKKLYKELGIKNLPIILFEQGVEKAEKYAMIARWMEDKGKYKQLRFPAEFDPTAEICDNKTDDNNDSKVDCDDPTCKDDLICRKEVPNKADVFIMSQCPYGVQAVDSMKEVLDNFKGKIKFDIHYIADKTGDNISSMHGQSEVDEDIRHLCVKKYYTKKDKYLDYIWCRNKNYRSDDWKSCATNGIVAATIEKCMSSGEGKKLLAEDLQLAKALKVSGSPTWLANNKFKFSGIAANDIKTNICEHNKSLAGCDKKLNEKTAVPAAGSCGK